MLTVGKPKFETRLLYLKMANKDKFNVEATNTSTQGVVESCCRRFKISGKS